MNKDDFSTYIIMIVIFSFFAYCVYFFGIDQGWCKDGGTNCVETAPMSESTDNYIPYGL